MLKWGNWPRGRRRSGRFKRPVVAPDQEEDSRIGGEVEKRVVIQVERERLIFIGGYEEKGDPADIDQPDQYHAAKNPGCFLFQTTLIRKNKCRPKAEHANPKAGINHVDAPPTRHTKVECIVNIRVDAKQGKEELGTPQQGMAQQRRVIQVVLYKRTMVVTRGGKPNYSLRDEIQYAKRTQKFYQVNQ